MIYVGLSESKGRGIFADKSYKKDDIIDISYSWVLTPNDLLLYEKTSVSGYWFDHPEKANYGLLPIGFAALLNHSKTPNALLTWKNSDLGFIGILTAIKDIIPNEELFIDYGIDDF